VFPHARFAVPSFKDHLMSLNLRKTSGNALSILSSDVMNRVTSFVLYAMVARHLGAEEFGQLTLAFTLFYTFQVFAVGGLKTLIVRQVAKDRAQTRLYFLNGIMIVTFTSVASLVALWSFVHVMRYPTSTTRVILLLSLGLLPYTISAVCEGLFQAWERMPYIAFVNVPVNIAKVAGAYALLATNRGLYPVVLVLLASLAAIAGFEIWIVLRKLASQPASVDLHFSVTTMRSAATFLGIDGTLAIMSSLNIILLSKLATETQVGLYSAATQLLVPLLLVYQSLAQSIFPVMCRKVEPGFQSLKRIAEQAIELLLVLALPAAAGLYFIGDRLISLLYKNPTFSQAFPALRIVAWVLVLQVFTSVLGQVLLASHREKITLRIVLVDTIFNLLVGWPLISIFGLRGASVALVLTRLADCIQHYIPVSRLVSSMPFASIVWKPLVAAACMAAYLAALNGRLGILSGVSATLIYAVALFSVAIWASGGLRQFKDKYRPLLSE
jgi:O-antigen/teichoic acid export membrane protein